MGYLGGGRGREGLCIRQPRGSVRKEHRGRMADTLEFREGFLEEVGPAKSVT